MEGGSVALICPSVSQPSKLISLRPQNGSMILYNRKKVKYRKDGYCWKKRKDGKTTREDHMKLKVQGVEVRGGVSQSGRGLTMRASDLLSYRAP
ncbi:hypothetical protein SKAU_G00171160 [Synaphobranchus kaupii]|uniref:CG-1 domain-containing protein n=1 Tax=Synaphobranchus kaupii TaxID=118154 RepID=A0A9Q1FKK9_SYNKA|nr:hypothetical protein SKAU_G00171160 [Synaphobranchus kaupii]